MAAQTPLHSRCLPLSCPILTPQLAQHHPNWSIHACAPEQPSCHTRSQSPAQHALTSNLPFTHAPAPNLKQSSLSSATPASAINPTIQPSIGAISTNPVPQRVWCLRLSPRPRIWISPLSTMSRPQLHRCGSANMCAGSCSKPQSESTSRKPVYCAAPKGEETFLRKVCMFFCPPPTSSSHSR